MTNFKTPAIRDRAWLDTVRGFRCVICGASPCDPAHIRYGLGGGMGLKPPDNLVLPLCHHHHMEQHQVGEAVFWGKALFEDDQLLMKCVKALAQLTYIQDRK